MSHDALIYQCCLCDQTKFILEDGLEIGRYCALDNKKIEIWGKDKCPKELNKRTVLSPKIHML